MSDSDDNNINKSEVQLDESSHQYNNSNYCGGNDYEKDDEDFVIQSSDVNNNNENNNNSNEIKSSETNGPNSSINDAKYVQDTNQSQLNQEESGEQGYSPPINLSLSSNDETEERIKVVEDVKRSNKSAIIYEIYVIEDKKEDSEINKKVLCYRRYSEFYCFYSALKIKYPEYAFTRIAEKNLILKITDNPKERDKRTKKLMYFINSINDHDTLGKSELFRKFLHDTEFDYFYFKNIPSNYKYLDKLESAKQESFFGKILGGFIGSKNKYDEEETRLMELLPEFEKKVKILTDLYSKLSSIYQINEKKAEYNLKTFKNFVYLREDKSSKQAANQNYLLMTKLAKLNQGENSMVVKHDSIFMTHIILPLEYCILDYQGAIRAIKRFNYYLDKYFKAMENAKENASFVDLIKKAEKDKRSYISILKNEVMSIDTKNLRIYDKTLENLNQYFKSKNSNMIELFHSTELQKENESGEVN